MEQKRTSVYENGLIWFGAGVSIAEIITGTYFAPLGFGKGLLAVIIGHIIGCTMLFLAGLIGGRTEGETRTVDKVYFLTNTDHSPEHFSMDPKEQLAAVKDMRANGLTPLGNWHSHPETPSRPSDEDKRLAYDSSASYLILSLMDPDTPALNSFHIEGDTASKEELIIL